MYLNINDDHAVGDTESDGRVMQGFTGLHMLPPKPPKREMVLIICTGGNAIQVIYITWP